MRRSHAVAVLAAVIAAVLVVDLPSAAATKASPAAEPSAFAKSSAFSCNLRWSRSAARPGSGAGSFVRITGLCAEGPFASVLIEFPRNLIAARVGPQMDGARCTRRSPRSVRCTVRSATSHVGARVALREKRGQRPRITFFDRAGSRLPWISTGGASAPLGASAPPPPGSGFPQTPLQAEGTFTGGSGGCPVLTAFKANFVWTAQGSTLRIDQLGTTHTVFGTITTVSANEWSWQASTPSGDERYTNGVIRRNSGGTGFTATADYAFTTTNGCTETYKVTFTL